MGTKSLVFRLTISLCFWQAAFTCMAATVTWNGVGGAGNANWSVGGNWGGAAPGLADTALFATAYGNGTTIELNVDATVAQLRFEHVANKVTLASTAAKQLTLTDATPLYRTGTADLTIAANLVLPNTANWSIDIRGSGTVKLDGEVNVTNLTTGFRYAYVRTNNSSSTASLVWNGAWSGTLGTSSTRFHLYGNPTGTVTINADNSAFNCADFRQFGGTLILNHAKAIGATRDALDQFIVDRGGSSATLLGGEFIFDYNTAVYDQDNHVVTLGTNIASGTAKWGTAGRKIRLLRSTNVGPVQPIRFAALHSGATLQVDALIEDYAVSTYNQGKRPVEIAGEGTVVFTNANTYGEGTTVRSGTLLVGNTSGSGTGTGPVAVEHGATLGGTGTIAGATTIKGGGTLAPAGAGIGTLMFGSDLTLENGAIWNWQLDGSGYDKVLGPKLILPDTPGSAIALNIAGDASGVSPGDSFTLFNGAVFQGLTELDGQFITGDLFTIHDTSGWWGTWEVMPGSLILTAVPEPGAWLLLLSALACGLPARRRRAARVGRRELGGTVSPLPANCEWSNP